MIYIFRAGYRVAAAAERRAERYAIGGVILWRQAGELFKPGLFCTRGAEAAREGGRAGGSVTLRPARAAHRSRRSSRRQAGG